MKRKILIITVLLLVVTMLFAVTNTVNATVKETADGAFVEVKNPNETKYYDNLNEALSNVEENATVTLLQNINSENIGENVDEYHRVVINVSKTFTFNFGGKTITSDSSLDVDIAAFAVKGGANVTFEGDGGIANNNGGGALLVADGSTVTLNGGAFSQKGTANKAGKVLNLPVVSCNASTLTVNEGVKITAKEGTGIGLFGNTPKLTIEGATVEAGSFAISGNGAKAENGGTENSTITIKKGTTLTSNKTAAIYHPQSGDLTVEDGTIKGYFGIVSRQGTVNVNGGTIIATGDKPETVGDAGDTVKLDVGAIVTDNKSAYGEGANPTKVTVKDGNIEGELVAREDGESDDFKLIGGAFDRKIPTAYLGNSLEVQKGDTYYLGNNAENALTNAESGDKLTVINGDVKLNGIHNGVEVTNEGSGEVSLNGTKVNSSPVTVVNQAEKDLAELKAELEKLEKDLNDEKVASEDARKELNTLKDRVDSLENENKELKDKIAELEAKVEKLEAEQPKTPTPENPSSEEEKGEESGELDDEPKTGDTYAISAGLVGLLSLVGAVVSKIFIK